MRMEIEELKERIHNTMESQILTEEDGKEEKSEMTKKIKTYLKDVETRRIIEEMRKPGTLSNSMMKIATEHENIIKKVGRNIVLYKNFHRFTRNHLHQQVPDSSAEETLALPTLAIIWYFMSQNITLEETLKIIITNNTTPRSNTNFTEEDRNNMKTNKKRPTRLKSKTDKTEKLPEKEKRRRAINKTDLDLLKEKMKTSSIKIKAKGKELEFKDVLLHQRKRKPDSKCSFNE